SKHGGCAACSGTGLKIDDVEWEEERARTGAEDNVLDSWIEWLEIDQACPQCEGRRLNPEALAVLWRGKNISDYGALPVSQLGSLFKEVDLLGREKEIARDLVAELRSRLGFLGDVGLGYLTLERSAPALSGRAALRSSAPTCAACATSSTSRPSACTTATTASCSTCWRSSRRRAIRWWWSSTTRTPSGARTMSSTSARAPAGSAARSSPRATPRT